MALLDKIKNIIYRVGFRDKSIGISKNHIVSNKHDEDWECVGDFIGSVSLGGTGEVANSTVTVRVSKLTGIVQHKVIPRSDPEFYGDKFMDGWEFDYPDEIKKKVDDITISIKRNSDIDRILDK